MTVRCPACNAYVDEKSMLSAGHMRCEKCGMRFSVPKPDVQQDAYRHDDAMGLGIHPALVKKYQNKNEAGPAQEDGDQPVAPEDGKQAAPEPWKSIQLSQSGSPAQESGAEARRPFPLDIPREERTRVLAGQRERKNLEKARQKATDGQDKDDPSDRPLIEIPGYQVVSIVGKGAMGQVYKGIKNDTGAAVAIKLLAKELAERQDFIARFEREAAALQAVEHSGVVSILDNGHHDDHHYLVMPFVEGVSLRRYMGQAPFPVHRALEFAIQILFALGASHSKRVIHRDLKPENIIVHRESSGPGQDPVEKLILVDFGLAGMGDDDPHPNLTKSRMTMGTVNYMAPEQRTDAKRVGPPADIYAAGVILYELLTGDLPLGRFKLPSERQGMGHLSKRIDHCIGRALDRDPAKRYPDADTFARELQSIQNDMAQTAYRDTVPGRAEKKTASSPNELTDDDDVSTGPVEDTEHGDTDVDTRIGFHSDPAASTQEQKDTSNDNRTAMEEQESLGLKRQMTLFAPSRRHELLFAGAALLIALIVATQVMPDVRQQENAPKGGGQIVGEANPANPWNTVSLDSQDWAKVPLGWAFDGSEILFSPKDPQTGNRQQATATYKHTIAGNKAEVSARILVASNVAEAEQSGKLKRSRYGGLFFKRGEEGIGLAFFSTRNCFFLRWRGDHHEPLQPVACGPGVKGRVQMNLNCEESVGHSVITCRAEIEGRAVGQTSLRVAKSQSDWELFLGCQNAACGFRDVRFR